MDLILQGGAASRLEKRLEQTWVSDSMIIALNSKLAAKVRAHLIASASAWRERMVFILLEQAKINSHLQSLATDAMEEQWGPTSASILILIEEMGGGVHWCEGAKMAWLEKKGLVDLCSRNNLEILEDSSSTFIATPSKRERFLYFQITSHKIAQKSKKSSLWHLVSSLAKGGEKRKLMRSWMEASQVS